MGRTRILAAAAVAAAAVLATSLAGVAPAGAQVADTSRAAEQQKIAKQLSNPVANLATIPIQFNWENGVGPNDDLRFVLNFQPVVPFSLSDNCLVVGRFILPYVGQPAGLVPGSPAGSGTGDIVASAFFGPKRSRVIWGLGPVLGLPTTSDPLLGSGKWSLGPTAVLVKQKGPWTLGFLANHLWSISDTGSLPRGEVSQTLLQPFLAYATRSAVTFSFNTETTYNWKAAGGEEWTVPIHASVSKVTRMGPFPFSIGAGAGYFAKSPAGGADWKLRLTYTLILPAGK